MNIKEFYAQVGDYDKALARLPMEAMLTRFAKKFLQDPSFSELLSGVESGDIQSAFRAVHNLKGVAGNLEYSALYEAACDLTEQLRPQTENANPELLARVKCEYEKLISCISQLD